MDVCLLLVICPLLAISLCLYNTFFSSFFSFSQAKAAKKKRITYKQERDKKKVRLS